MGRTPPLAHYHPSHLEHGRRPGSDWQSVVGELAIELAADPATRDELFREFDALFAPFRV